MNCIAAKTWCYVSAGGTDLMIDLTKVMSVEA